MINKGGVAYLRNFSTFSLDDTTSVDNKTLNWNMNLTKLNLLNLENLLNKDKATSLSEAINANRLEFFNLNTIKLKDDDGNFVYQCVLCKKVFSGENYVHSHILNKHFDEVKKQCDVKVSNYFEFRSMKISNIRISMKSQKSLWKNLNALKV